jgi:hypothetical protein
MGNWSAHTVRLRLAERSSADELIETLVAQLADDVEYWKAQSETLERTLDEKRAEVRRLRRDLEKTEAWRKALAEELVEFTRIEHPVPHVERRALGGLILGLSAAVFLWALLGLLALGGYRLLGS